jgi:hypothetical protein
MKLDPGQYERTGPVAYHSEEVGKHLRFVGMKLPKTPTP